MARKAQTHYTVAEAAKELGVSTRQVRFLITNKKLDAEKFGRDYSITSEALAAVPRDRRPGRPKKASK